MNNKVDVGMFPSQRSYLACIRFPADILIPVSYSGPLLLWVVVSTLLYNQLLPFLVSVPGAHWVPAMNSEQPCLLPVLGTLLKC